MVDEPASNPRVRPTVGVLVVADDPLARRTIATTLSGCAGVVVVAQSSSDSAFEEAVERAAPDAIVWDLGPGGVAAEEFWIDAEVPVVALLDGLELAGEVLRGGASGILTREADGQRLEAALRGVLLGLTILESPPAELLDPPAIEEPSASPRGPLTARERQVLELLAEGLSNRVIAERLDISEHTAKFHVNAILSKLGARTRTEAVVTAARGGLLIL